MPPQQIRLNSHHKENYMSYDNETKTLARPGKLGDHPIGGAVGAVIGAAEGAIVVGALEGAILGTVAGLPGMAAGVAIGGVVGALAGKEFAQLAVPNAEEVYWRDNYKNRAYFDSVITYDNYAPAYRYGIE